MEDNIEEQEIYTIENKKYNLYSNMCRDFIASGYKYLESFEKDYIPIFTYKVNNITIKKLICMQYGKNTVCVLYKIDNPGKQAKFTITPIINFRDFHTMTTNWEFSLKQNIKNKKVKIEINDNLFFMSNFSFKNNSKMFNSYLLSFF